MQQSEENTPSATDKSKKTVKGITPELQQMLLTLYDNVAWCVNEINKINLYLNGLQTPQQSQPYYPVPLPPAEPQPTGASFTPTFSKRTGPAQPEPEKPAKKPWYKQKGIIFGIILGLLVLYFVYLMIMKASGHTVTIPGLGKF